MSPTPTYRPSLDFLHAIPKTDLHVHLDGSLRIETVRELAAEYQLPHNFRTAGDVRRVCQVDQNCSSLEEYLKVFEVTLQLMQRVEDLERVAYELAEDAHHENVRYMEVRYSPLLHRGAEVLGKLAQFLEAGFAAPQDIDRPADLHQIHRATGL